MSKLNGKPILAMLLAMAFGCDSSLEPDTVSAVLKGKVTTTAGAPVSGVSVLVVNWPTEHATCKVEDTAPNRATTSVGGAYSLLLQKSETRSNTICLAVRFRPAEGSGLQVKDTLLPGTLFRKDAPPPEYELNVILMPNP